MRIALVLCSLVLSVLFLRLWGTRWGERHLLAKSLALSLLVHLCFMLGWATVASSTAAGNRQAFQAHSEPPIPVRFAEAASETPVETTAWLPPSPETVAAPTRHARQPEIQPLDDQRLETAPVSEPTTEPAVEFTASQDVVPSVARQDQDPSEPPVEPAPVAESAEPERIAPEQVPEVQPASPARRSTSRRSSAEAPLAADTPKRIADDEPFQADSATKLEELTPRRDADTPAGLPTRRSRPQRLKNRPLQAERAPVEPVQDAPLIGKLHGVIRDAETGRILAGALIRFDRAEGKPLTAMSDEQGRYELPLSEPPDSFVVSASRDDYLPQARKLRRGDVDGRTRRLDFALHPPTDSVVSLEDEPEVHHLGNDRFQGSANSQFQRRAEGSTWETTFRMSREQIRRRFPHAIVSMLAKGVQSAPRLWINDRELAPANRLSPADGSYGKLQFQFPANWLRAGENSFRIDTVPVKGDLDDFELINVEVRLSTSELIDGEESSE